MTNSELMKLAEKARENAYAKYSNFKVGAAVLCEDGRIFMGANVENTCGTSCCAERVAIHTAVVNGARKFDMIAVAAELGTFPCGICRQTMVEFSPDIRVIVKTNDGLKEHIASDLLPNAFLQE